MSEASGPAEVHHTQPATVETVEEVVRAQLAKALGGRRGMIEAAVPTLVFTILWLTTRELTLALSVSIGAAVAMLLVRVVQRSSPQFALNAIFGIGIGWVFVRIAESRGGSADDQALAYFLPGLIYNSAYSVVLAFTCLIGWPLVGFMVGSVTGDPTAWHQDRQIVRLCTRLTWVLGMPGMVGVALQAPVWLAGWSGTISAESAVLAITALRYGLGWPLRIGAFALMTWLLARNHTPISPPEPESDAEAPAEA